MDDRHEGLLVLLESGESVDDVSLLQMIEALSNTGLGPDSIDGVSTSEILSADPRMIALQERKDIAEGKALQVIKRSKWYLENRHPTPLNPVVLEAFEERGVDPSFRSWVDRRMRFHAAASRRRARAWS